jgi:hypothetical protein
MIMGLDLIHQYHHVMHRVIIAVKHFQIMFYVTLLSENNLQSLKIINFISVEMPRTILQVAQIQVDIMIQHSR